MPHQPVENARFFGHRLSKAFKAALVSKIKLYGRIDANASSGV